MKNMKKALILGLFALTLISIPQKTHAFKLERLIDPACLFACDNGGSKTVVNTTTYNTPAPTPTTPYRPPTNHYPNDGYRGSNYRDSDYYPTYIPAPQRPVQITVQPQPVYVTPPTPVYAYNDSYYSYPNYNYNQLGVSCYSTYAQGSTGDTIVWRASAYGGNGNYYITWSGTDGLYGNGSSISTTYYYSGAKTASVTVTSGGQTITQNCNTVQISGNSYNYNNNYNNYNNYNGYNSQLYASCSANTTSTQIGSRIVWQANAYGGNGYYSYNWYGTDSLSGSGQNLDTYYNAPGSKSAYVVVRSGNQTITQYCSNTVTVGGYNTYPYNDPTPVVKNTQTTIIKYLPAPTKTTEPTTVTPTTTTPAPAPLSLNIPWGWISFLVIVILLFAVVYLIFARKKA